MGGEITNPLGVGSRIFLGAWNAGSRNTKKITLLCLLVVIVGIPALAQKPKFTVLHTFQGRVDGAVPNAGLLRDSSGNLFGTTLGGGASNYGAVFAVMASGKEKVLYSFRGDTDGSSPAASLIQANGQLYGTTMLGDSSSAGTVFQVSKSNGTEQVLGSFPIGADGGGYPEGGLIRDARGNLYGTTSGYNGGGGNGAVFEVSAAGVLTVLYNFTGGTDGLCPLGNLVRDSAGNLYGTTYRGGTYGFGTVYKVTPSGAETILYSFTGGLDGSFPAAGLVRDTKGNLYGTTTGGGPRASGTVFAVAPGGKETVLHSFKNQPDGFSPVAGLALDASGNLFGTTVIGGRHDHGMVFEITAAGKELVLHNFTGSTDGGSPGGSLVLDKYGSLYGTTAGGGSAAACTGGCGVVFRWTP